MKKTTKYTIGIVIVLLIVVAGYFSFAHGGSAKSRTVTIGIMSGTKQDDKIWDTVSKTAKDKYQINLKFKKFTDYTQPNKALANGDVNLNAFQHYAFLHDWNKANKGSLVPIGKTFITPIRIYSKKIHNLKDIKKGGSIAVPNDATNESRALILLQTAGLIKLNPKDSVYGLKSITSNPKNLKIKELDASQTARALSDVDAAVINTNFAQTAGLNYKSAIYVEPVNKDSKQWINVIVANKKDQNKKIYKDVVKAYQTAATKKIMHQEYGTAQLPAWDIKIK